jgi:hypothetical protein
VPALPDVPGVIRMIFKFDVGTDADAITRIYMGYTGTPPDSASIESWLSGGIGPIGDELVPVMSTDTTFLGIEATDLSSPTGGTATITASAAGTRTGGRLSGATAVLGNYAIGRRYRGGKPRGYWPLGTASDLETRNQWASASVDAFDTALNVVIPYLADTMVGSATTSSQQNVSYYEGFTAVVNPITGRTKDVAKLRTGGPVVDAVTQITVNVHPASQRRRDLIRS